MSDFTGFTDKAEKAVNNALSLAENLGHTYVGSEHILLGLLKEKNSVAATALEELGIEFENVETLIKEEIGAGSRSSVSREDFTPRTREILESAVICAAKEDKKSVGTEHILLSIVEDDESYAMKLIEKFGAGKSDIVAKIKGAWSGDDGLIDKKTEDISGIIFPKLNREPQQGKVSVLNRFGKDLTKEALQGKIDPVIGRNKEIERIIQILSRRSKNNPCLIGEPGVGKTAVVEGLALKISMGLIPDMMKEKKIIALDLTGMLAGTKYRGDFEERIKSAIDEVKKNPDIILFLDEIHTIVGTGSAEGSADAANILKPYLTKGNFQLIGATTLKEYRKHVEKDPALERRLQPVFVNEPSQQQAFEIIKGLKNKYENFHGVEITDTAIKAAVELSSRYIADRFLPDKALDLIDEAASRTKINTHTLPDKINDLERKINTLSSEKESAVNNQDFELAAQVRDMEKELTYKLKKEKSVWQNKNEKTSKRISAQDVAAVVSNWTDIPVMQLTCEETKKLLNMENIIHKRVIGQNKAVSAVSHAIRRGRTGIKDPKRPIGSFIFLGPTGVGKTELCKALAEAVFGTEDALIRFDMSEFMEKHTASKLIGSPPGYVGYDEGGQLTEKVRRKPYSVVLFDEIEKADADIFNMLLQILEDGQLTDSQGRKVNFKNTIIIMTSNIGAKFITDKGVVLGFSDVDPQMSDEKITTEKIMHELKNVFKPELLNRVDETIVFKRLSLQDVKLITRKTLDILSQRVKSMDITISFSEEAIERISQKGLDDAYGARPLKRLIQHEIEDKLAQQILEKKIKKRDKMLCDFKNGEFVLI